MAKHNNAREPGQAVSYVGLDTDKNEKSVSLYNAHYPAPSHLQGINTPQAARGVTHTFRPGPLFKNRFKEPSQGQETDLEQRMLAA